MERVPENSSEHHLRREVARYLSSVYGYEQNSIVLDFPVFMGENKRVLVDIALFPPGVKQTQDEVSLIVECKAGSQPIELGTSQLQALMAACSNCRYGVLVDREWQIWKKNVTASGDTEFRLVTGVPGYGTEPIMRCQDNLDFMNQIEDSTFKLIVTSPPYNLGKGYETKSTFEDYLHSQKKVIKECVRLLHPQGSICWQVGNYLDNGEIVPLDVVLYPYFRELGLRLRNRIIWSFGHGLHSSRRLSGRYETINWWTKGDDYTWNLDPIRVAAKYPNKRHYKGPNKGKPSGNPMGKNPGDVWEIPNVKNNHPEKTSHPCQFPVELVQRLVLSMTNQGDKIFDPYMGVGSSVLAALMHDRIGFGCDSVDEYVDLAWQRVDLLNEGNLRTRPMGKPIYNPSFSGGGRN